VLLDEELTVQDVDIVLKVQVVFLVPFTGRVAQGV